jgi:cobalt-zinc-cadmium efflux system outer membrane protein
LRTITFLLVCLTPGLAPAQTAPPLPVDDAVGLAIRNNPRLTAAARQVAAARLGVRSAGALTNPSVLFTPAITRGGSDEELLLQQPLELNGTRTARKGVAIAQLRQAQAEAVVELRTLVWETRSAYCELARAQELRTVAADALTRAEELDRATQSLVVEGLRPGIDRVQTGVEVTRARLQVTQAEARVATARTALNTLLGRDGATAVTAALPAETSPAAPDREAAVAAGLTNRTEIQAEDALREGFRQQGRMARAEGRPDIAPQFRAGGVTRGVEDAGVGVGFTLPFLDYGSRRNRIRQAEESARAQEARVEVARARVRQEVEQALARLSAAGAVAQDYHQGVLDRARQLLEGSRTRYLAGQTSILELLEAQRTFRSVQSEYANALADYAIAQADLEQATGAVAADRLPAPSPTPTPEKK